MGNELNVTEAEETGMTFEANAILKARNACEQTGLPALADDSGLEVDALQGEPGVFSARFAKEEDGFGSGDAANNAKLLHCMQGIPDKLRTARFRCVLVYMRSADDPEPQVFEGISKKKKKKNKHSKKNLREIICTASNKEIHKYHKKLR